MSTLHLPWPPELIGYSGTWLILLNGSRPGQFHTVFPCRLLPMPERSFGPRILSTSVPDQGPGLWSHGLIQLGRETCARALGF
jgi:hypothetical protein